MVHHYLPNNFIYFIHSPKYPMAHQSYCPDVLRNNYVLSASVETKAIYDVKER